VRVKISGLADPATLRINGLPRWLLRWLACLRGSGVFFTPAVTYHLQLLQNQCRLPGNPGGNRRSSCLKVRSCTTYQTPQTQGRLRVQEESRAKPLLIYLPAIFPQGSRATNCTCRCASGTEVLPPNDSHGYEARVKKAALEQIRKNAQQSSHLAPREKLLTDPYVRGFLDQG
jgi:hypothetical protein